jgi:Flp pilus assembly pilin Flp
VTVEALTRTIGAMIAPVVMITSCLIFLNGLWTRYEAISARMRAMHRERLDMMDGMELAVDRAAADPVRSRQLRRIQEMEHQLPGLLRRHRGVRDAVTAVSFALIALVMSMFLIAGAEIVHLTQLNMPALDVFLLGTAAFLLGVVINTFELWRSQREVAYEVQDGLRMR